MIQRDGRGKGLKKVCVQGVNAAKSRKTHSPGTRHDGLATLCATAKSAKG